jgi:hypothetical protein
MWTFICFPDGIDDSAVVEASAALVLLDEVSCCRVLTGILLLEIEMVIEATMFEKDRDSNV